MIVVFPDHTKILFALTRYKLISLSLTLSTSQVLLLTIISWAFNIIEENSQMPD